jgi:hypothetical protein
LTQEESFAGNTYKQIPTATKTAIDQNEKATSRVASATC